jgi:hypothetical protein
MLVKSEIVQEIISKITESKGLMKQFNLKTSKEVEELLESCDYSEFQVIVKEIENFSNYSQTRRN